jgi:hypothetical protein
MARAARSASARPTGRSFSIEVPATRWSTLRSGELLTDHPAWGGVQHSAGLPPLEAQASLAWLLATGG